MTAPLYAVLEGLFIGAVSAMFELRFPGIVMQAAGLTFGTLGALLLAYRSGLIKATENFKLGVFAATGGIALLYPDIECNELIVDNCCMQLVMKPEQFDVIVTTNLFGDIISDLCAGLVGGLGLAPGANIGADAAIFEAVHGSAPDIAGKGIANPCALLLGAAQLLDHLGMPEKATKLREAIVATLEAKDSLTPDLGGSGDTMSFAKAIASRV